MGRRRRKAAEGDQGIIGPIVDTLIDLAREAPAIGISIAAGMFVVGGVLFKGDPAQWAGMGRFLGMILLLLAGTVGGIAVVCMVRSEIAGRSGQFRDRVQSPSQTFPSRTALADPHRSETAPPRDGQAFERFVAGHFRMQGYHVEETGTHGRGGDRGVDLVLRRPDAPETPKICVQCKDYAAWKVGAEAVRAFAGAVALRGPGHTGWIVTTGRFTADAVRDARQLEIHLIDGEAWSSITRAAGTDSLATTVRHQPAVAESIREVFWRDADVPLCPRCRIAMVRRDPRPGGKQFRPFWGCANYPRCRATVDIA